MFSFVLANLLLFFIFILLEYVFCRTDPRQGKVLVLTYHDLKEDEEGKHDNIYYTRRSDFVKQMSYLKQNDYKIISFQDLINKRRENNPLSGKIAIITFDDGDKNWLSVACPSLTAFGFKATFFPRLDWISQKITWGDLKKIKETMNIEGDPLFDVQSHTVGHTLLERGQNEKEDNFVARLELELQESKRTLDSELDQDTKILALPYGAADDRKVLELAWNSGYQAVRAVCGSKLLRYLPTQGLILISQYSDNALKSYIQFRYAVGKSHRSLVGNYFFWLLATPIAICRKALYQSRFVYNRGQL